MKDISDELLQRLAGSDAFARGLASFHAGQVTALKHKGNTITAEVMDGEPMRVTLKHTSRIFEGSCTCPASDGIDFCGHCVAAALAYRDTQGKEQELKGVKAKDRLPAYLMTLDKQQLVDAVLELISHDKIRHKEWQLRADQAAGKLSDKNIKQQINAVMPLNRAYHRAREVREFFAKVEAACTGLAPLLEKFDQATALALVDYAFERLSTVMGRIDDSGGLRYPLLGILGNLHIHHLGRSELSPEARAKHLVALHAKGGTDFYPAIPEDYQQVLGEEGMASFLTQLRAHWDALPPPAHSWHAGGRYLSLAMPLLEDAKARGDRPAIIAIRAKMAVEFRDYLQMSALCLDSGDLDQALQWRKRAEQTKTRPWYADQELEENQLLIWQHQGLHQKILTLLWQRFREQLSLKAWKAIAQLPGEENNPDNYTKAVEFLQQTVAGQPLNNRTLLALSTLAHLHLHCQYPLRALELAEQTKLDPNVLLTIARANPDQPARTIPLYFRWAQAVAGDGDARFYREVASVLHQARAAAGTAHADQFTSEFSALYTKHRRKYGLMEAFAETLPDLIHKK